MIIRNLLYIFQKESYDQRRLLRFAYANIKWWGLEKRQKIDWTAKAVLIFVIAHLILLAINFSAFWLSPWLLALSVPLTLITLPCLLVFSAFVIKPLESLAKYLIIQRAKKILARLDLKVVGITGSYGKTTTKEILFSMLKARYKVVKTPENINTEIGIADYIIKHRDVLTESEYFIVEMGAYRQGDIKKICRIVKPDYSILTGIGEAHLERFGSLENTARAKFELPQATSKISYLNFNNANVKYFAKHLAGSNCRGVDSSGVTDVKRKENFFGLEFTFNSVKINIRLLAEHNIDLIVLAASLAQELGITVNESALALSAMEPLEHRLRPIFNRNAGITVIDDSYNGNFAGFLSGLEVLEQASGRKLVLTPGIVELGEKKEKRHRELARIYVKSNLDLVLLIKNSATGFIADEFNKNNFTRYKMYNSAPAAHDDLKNILRSGDTILFQNDITDNYL